MVYLPYLNSDRISILIFGTKTTNKIDSFYSWNSKGIREIHKFRWMVNALCAMCFMLLYPFNRRHNLPKKERKKKKFGKRLWTSCLYGINLKKRVSAKTYTKQIRIRFRIQNVRLFPFSVHLIFFLFSIGLWVYCSNVRIFFSFPEIVWFDHVKMHITHLFVHDACYNGAKKEKKTTSPHRMSFTIVISRSRTFNG